MLATLIAIVLCGDVLAAIRLQPDHVTVGDVFTITVEVPVQPGDDVAFPERLTIDGVRVLDAMKASTEPNLARRVYRAAAFVVGDHAIGPIDLDVKNAGSTKVVGVKGATVHVASVVPQAATAEVKGLRGPAEPARNRRRDGWMAIASLMLGILVGVLIRWLRREKIRKAPPPIPPHVRALRALDALRTADVSSEPAIAAYFVAVSSVVRHYIEERFQLRAPELTTEEFLDAASSGPSLVAEHRGRLERFLEHADLVKFARHHPQPAACREALEQACEFVVATKPEPATGVVAAPATAAVAS